MSIWYLVPPTVLGAAQLRADGKPHVLSDDEMALGMEHYTGELTFIAVSPSGNVVSAGIMQLGKLHGFRFDGTDAAPSQERQPAKKIDFKATNALFSELKRLH